MYGFEQSLENLNKPIVPASVKAEAESFMERVARFAYESAAAPENETDQTKITRLAFLSSSFLDFIDSVDGRVTPDVSGTPAVQQFVVDSRSLTRNFLATNNKKLK